MYFRLDENDIVYYSDGTPLYRVIATEDFQTVNPIQDNMMGETVLIKEGEKGGYISSELCLEEELGLKVKPWVFFSAEIVSAIISGASVVYGNSKIYNSLISSGCIIRDSNVYNSKVKTKYWVVKDKHILISCIVESKSYINNSEIQNDNVIISFSTLNKCSSKIGYGNIYIRNASLSNLQIPCDFKAKDIEADSIQFDSGIYNLDNINELTKNKILPLAKEISNHKDLYAMLSFDDKIERGVYKNVEYHPIFK